MQLGYSHPVVFKLPKGVGAKVDKNKVILDLVRPGHPGADRGQDPRAARARALQGQGRQVRRRSHQAQGRQGRRHRRRRQVAGAASRSTEERVMARKSKLESRKIRHRSLRKRIAGHAERPRLVVFRSARHIYAQVIDDLARKTLVAASDLLPRRPTRRPPAAAKKRQEERPRQGGGHSARQAVPGEGYLEGGLRSRRLQVPRPRLGGGGGGPRGRPAVLGVKRKDPDGDQLRRSGRAGRQRRLHQPRGQGGQGRPPVLLLGAGGGRRSARLRRRRPGQGQRGSRGHPQGDRAGQEEPVQDPAHQRHHSARGRRASSAPAWSCSGRPAPVPASSPAARCARCWRSRGSRTSSPSASAPPTPTTSFTPPSMRSSSCAAPQRRRRAARARRPEETGTGVDIMAKKLKVTLVRSGINRPEPQKRTIRAAGPAQDAPDGRAAGQPGGPRHDPVGLPPGEGRGGRVGARDHVTDPEGSVDGDHVAHPEGPARRHPEPQAHRPRSRLGHRRDSPARASRARRPAPATTAPASASRAVRCRCSAGCPRSASRTRSAASSSPVNLGHIDDTFDAGGTVGLDELQAGGPGAPRKASWSRCWPRASSARSCVIKAHKFSAAAKEKIEKAGGTAELDRGRSAAA